MTTSLTFQDGNAENAMDFYVTVFKNSKITSVMRWGKNGPCEEGKIMKATFELDGNHFMCSDSPPVHKWNFTPAVSTHVQCENEEDAKSLLAQLSKDGDVKMPLDDYGFGGKFAWVDDQYGVSWQLSCDDHQSQLSGES